MRKGLTLIELILSMVIIGIVFTVIPKLVMSMNQGTQVTMKEEAMYNAMAQMGMILNLPWDNNKTQNSQILTVNTGDVAYDCNTTSGYRIGGFIGGRNCIAPSGISYNASAIIKEDNESNDIDDFHDTNITADKNCSGVVKGIYKIGTTVTYLSDPSSIGVADLNLSTQAASSNSKRIWIRVGYGPDHKLYDSANPNNCITSLEYHSFNIGHIQINSRNWN